MLDSDYQQHLGSLIQSLEVTIQLPAEMSEFFKESGPIASCINERRKSVRTRVRTTGVLVPRRWLPACPRRPEPQHIYTKDFSKTGFGCLSSTQFYPGEIVRVLLATFWIEVEIRRCRRLGTDCFELGGELVQTRQPSAEAFNFAAPTAVASPACDVPSNLFS